MEAGSGVREPTRDAEASRDWQRWEAVTPLGLKSREGKQCYEGAGRAGRCRRGCSTEGAEPLPESMERAGEKQPGLSLFSLSHLLPWPPIAELTGARGKASGRLRDARAEQGRAGNVERVTVGGGKAVPSTGVFYAGIGVSWLLRR